MFKLYELLLTQLTSFSKDAKTRFIVLILIIIGATLWIKLGASSEQASTFVLTQLQECKDKNMQLENKIDRIEEKYKAQIDTLNIKIFNILIQQQTINQKLK